MKLGKISYIELRKQWPSEPRFSDWLSEEENLAELSSAIGIELSFVKREEKVGRFQLDILAKEEGGDRYVAIENQYDQTDHDHLGKLITYAAGCNAKTIIWVVEKVCEEHQAAIKWLNDNLASDVGIFLLQVKLVKIGNSDVAPLFKVIEQPNGWARDAKSQTSELTERQKTRLDFWTKFSEYACNDKNFTSAFNPRKPSTDHWMNYYCGFSSFHISLTITGKDRIGVEIYMPDDKEQYEQFKKSKDKIESELALNLDWQPLPGKKAARIYYGTRKDWTKQESLKDCFEWLAQNAVAMKTVFCKYAR